MKPGTALPAENLSADETAALQRSIDRGRQPWRLYPDMVAEGYVRSWFAWENLGVWFDWEDVGVAMGDAHTAEVRNRSNGQMLRLHVRQPERHGPRGIWVVTGGGYVGGHPPTAGPAAPRVSSSCPAGRAGGRRPPAGWCALPRTSACW